MIRCTMAGIDASRYDFDVCLKVKRQVFRRRFSQEAGGFEGLLAYLSEIGVARAWFAIEHTGGYERRLAEFLIAAGHRVSLVDGLRVQRFKESLGMRAKTDPGDALALARYMKERRRDRSAPVGFFPNMVAAIPTAADFLRACSEPFRRRQILSAHVQNHFAHVQNHFAHAQSETLIELLKLQVAEAEKAIEGLVASQSELARAVELLCTTKGVKRTTAIAFLAEAGPIEAYPTPESLALAAGLAPLPRFSGRSLKGTYTKPYGNQNLRNCLNLPASVARRHNPAMRQFAQRLQAKGKPTALQNRAVKRKLVHIFWGILTRKEPVDPAKAIANFKST